MSENYDKFPSRGFTNAGNSTITYASAQLRRHTGATVMQAQQIEMFETQVVEYSLPAHWIAALVYGDYSGIESDSECQVIESFIEEIGMGIIEIPEDSEPHFNPWHDARDWGILPADCIDFTVTYLQSK